MSKSYTINHVLNTGGAEIATSYTSAEGLEVGLYNEEVAAETTDKEFILPIDVSQVAYLLIHSDKDLTLKTNSTSEPGNTLALQAGVPYEWHKKSYDTLKLTADVTKIFATNASDADKATLNVRCLLDATP